MDRPLDRACRLAAGVVLAVALAAGSAQARSPEIHTGVLSSTAMGGYDAVAYFREGRPVAGKSGITWTWKGATWRFASTENREAFKQKPDAYAPAYGGYCAWAVSQGYIAKGDPKYWKIVDGKLYLNYDARVQKDWERDIPGHISNANANWPGVLDK
jgi:YHS domain-containing protein